MSQRAKNKRLHDELMVYMKDFDDADLPDGAWQALLMEAAEQFNALHGTTYDAHDAFLDYCSRMSPF